MPSDTLGPIQVTEAWIWNEMTNFIFGEGASTLSTHNGWMTRIELNHVDFPGSFNHVALYVSDECAGVHEMIFLSTLVAMTEGVPQKLKIRSIIVMCSIIYVLNIMRLVVFYPIAVQECVAMPNQAELNKFNSFFYRSRCGPFAAAEPGSETWRPPPWQPDTSQQP